MHKSLGSLRVVRAITESGKGKRLLTYSYSQQLEKEVQADCTRYSPVVHVPKKSVDLQRKMHALKDLSKLFRVPSFGNCPSCMLQRRMWRNHWSAGAYARTKFGSITTPRSNIKHLVMKCKLDGKISTDAANVHALSAHHNENVLWFVFCGLCANLFKLHVNCCHGPLIP